MVGQQHVIDYFHTISRYQKIKRSFELVGINLCLALEPQSIVRRF